LGDFVEIGFLEEDCDKLCWMFVCFYGGVFVCGLIGLGKSIMFYLVFGEVVDGMCMIIMIEDLVEYWIEGIK